MNNVALSIDEKRCVLKIMYVKDKAIYYKEKTIYYKEYPFPAECLEGSRPDFEKVFSSALAPFITQENILPATVVYVLPNRFAAGDFLEIPAVLRKKQASEAVSLETAARIKDSERFRISSMQFGEHDGKNSYATFMIRSDLIESIQSALKNYKFVLRGVTFEAAMLVNSFVALKGVRREPILLCDFRKDNTSIALIRGFSLGGYASLPFGENLFTTESRIVNSPSVLPNEKFYRENVNSALDLCETDGGPTGRNVVYLMRTLMEMCDTLSARYHIDNVGLRYNLNKSCSATLETLNSKAFNGLEPMNIKNQLAADHLELYGALNPSDGTKGLIF